MKKLLLTLFVSFAMCGSIFAQYESNWPDFYSPAYEDQGALVAAIVINGQIVTAENHPSNWDALEIAFFIGDECRGNNNYLYNGYVEEYGDPFPIIDGNPVYYTTAGGVVTVQMYDHVNGILYEECTVTLLGDPFEIIGGDDNMQGWDDPENPIMLNFEGEDPGLVTSGFTKEILGYGTGNDWYLISSPVGEVNPSNVTNMVTEEAEAYDLYAFDQNYGDEWRNFKVTENGYTVLETGKGYLYAREEGTTLTFSGTAYNGDGQFDLAYNGEANLPGYNLMGNPFAEPATVDRPFYTLTPETGVFESHDAGEEIAAMEGCFVEAGEEGETVTFSVAGGEKSANLALNLTQGRALVDRAIVSFAGNTLSKFQFNPNSTKLYIPQDGKDYAVVSAGEMGEMPVNFKAEESGSFNMSFNAEGVSFNYLHLIDNLTGADVDLLATPSYSFDALTTDYASRFRLVFATGNAEGESFGFFSDGNFIISNEGEATVQVVDVTGRILSSETINGSASINLSGAAGVYMIRLINGENVRVQKVVVR